MEKEKLLLTRSHQHAAIGILFEMEKEDAHPPFDRLRANGSGAEIAKDFPFVLSLSKHERRSPTTSHLGKLYAQHSCAVGLYLVVLYIIRLAWVRLAHCVPCLLDSLA
jgi:hypothetical protein